MEKEMRKKEIPSKFGIDIAWNVTCLAINQELREIEDQNVKMNNYTVNEIFCTTRKAVFISIYM